MSADNWRTCPQCFKTISAQLDEQEREARAAYGKVSAEGYVEGLEKVRLARAEKDEDAEVLREDYWLGIEVSGEFIMSYSAHCDRCGFSYKYKYTADTTKEE